MRSMSSANGVRWLVGLVAALALSACDGTAADPPGEVDSSVPDAAVASCELPIEGCSCDVEGATAECWPDALVENGMRVCLVGERTCTGGVWGLCDNVHRMTDESGAGVVIEAASDDPAVCASCEPRCFRALDTIRSRDVMERGGNGLVFNPDPGRGGAENPGELIICRDPSCGVVNRVGAGTGTPWMPTPENSDGVTVDPSDGALVLGVLGLNSPGVWVANTGNGTISRFDPATGRELGRYRAELPGPTRGRSPYPSRTSVDQNFDCIVANRAFGGQGTVTKIASQLTRCVDRNANGRIDTSTDRNMNGRIDMGDPTEYYGANDECLVWTVDVGVNNGVPRAVAIGLAPAGVDVGDIWVGNYNERRAYRLRSSDGAILGSAATGNIHMYGAAIDARGRVFFYARQWSSQVMGYLNPTTLAFTHVANAPYNFNGYGMTYYVSADGSQEYFFTADSDYSRVLRYNVLANNWTWTNAPGIPRGMAADTGGNVYAAGWGPDWGRCNRNLWRWDTNLANFQQWTAPSAGCFMGVGVTFDNAVWLIGDSGSRGARLAADRATWLETQSVLSGPYTYSDFIGYGLNVFANPRGHYAFVTDAGDACVSTQRWDTITWDAVAPVGTTVEVWVRVADTTAGLATATWYGPWRSAARPATANVQMAPGPVPSGRYLEMDLRMETTDRRLTPRIYSASASGFCDHTEYATGATYTRLYNSLVTEDAAVPSVICDEITEAPIWGDFTWGATLPPGTSITFEFRGGRTPAEVAAATPITFVATPASVPPTNLTSLLRAAGVDPMGLNPPLMEVRAILNSSPDRYRTPTLRTMSLEFTCFPIG